MIRVIYYFHYCYRFAFNIVLIQHCVNSPVESSKVKVATQTHLIVFLSFNLTSGVSGLPLLEHLRNSCAFF